MKILGVTFMHNLSVEFHVLNICQSAMQSMFAIKLLQHHGMVLTSVRDVFQAIVISRLTYAYPAWGGFLNTSSLNKLQPVIHKGIKWGFYTKADPSFSQIVEKRDSNLFNTILSNPLHVLHHLLTPVKSITYNLRPRAHNRTLPPKCGNLIDKNFLIHMLCS